MKESSRRSRKSGNLLKSGTEETVQYRQETATRGRICIVTGELAGPDFNGGIGTANRGLALALQGAGYAVDVLYTRVEGGRPFSFRGSFAQQVAALRALGVNLMCISHDGNWDDWLAKSLRVMEVLNERSYDIAFFDDTHGTAYYSALAKKTGSAGLAATQIVVVAHSATQWISELNQTPVSSLNDIKLMEMERRSIELADHLVAPSGYILEKYRSYGWALPERTLVRPNILPFSMERPVPPRKSFKFDEFVFFGRLERRKGLWLFCEALDRLKYEMGGTKVTFLGKFTTEDGESTGFSLLRRSLSWPFSPNILCGYDRDQALAYLKGGARLAVLPSIEDNSPCAILECLIEGIPLLASSGSGGQELISPADHQHSLFEPTVDALTARLREALKGEAATSQPAFSPLGNARKTLQWVAELLAERRAQMTAPSRQGAGAGRMAGSALMRTFLLFAPEDMAPQTVADLAEQSAALHPDASIIVFADGMSASKPASKPGRIRIAGTADFADVASSIAAEKGLAVICRLDQPVEPQVLARAEICLSSTSIDAVTVMRGHKIESAQPDERFVCAAADSWQPEAYKTGNMQALLPLCQDAGEGLLVLRSEHLASVRDVSPIDKLRCRLKDMAQYVHELLLKLSAEGRRFELLPDCFISAVRLQSRYETSAFPRIALDHVKRTRALPPGSEKLLLARLTIEALSAKLARHNAHNILAEPISRAGNGITQPENFWPPSRAFETYARVALVSGRPDLALSLLGQSIGTNKQPTLSKPVSPFDLASIQALSINLPDLVTAGRFAGLNLEHPWSLSIEDDGTTIEIHPNAQNEGQAALMFPGLSISGPSRFTAELQLAASAKGPVKFEIDIQLPVPNGEALHTEWDIQPGQIRLVEIEVPPAFVSVCDVLLATRMVRRTDSTEGAHAKWRRPGFSPL